MTDHIGSPGAEFRVGRVIARGISVYFGNIVPIFILSVIAYLPLIVIVVIFGANAQQFESIAEGTSPVGAAGIVAIALFILAGVVGWTWLSAGITYGVIAALRQGRINVGEALATSLRSVLPLIGLGVMAIAIFVAMLLLNFIPFVGTVIFAVLGLYLVVRWWVVIPAIVVERISPLAGLKRAAALSKGNFWKIFAVIVLWGVVAMIIGIVVQLVLSLTLGVSIDLDGAEFVTQAAGSGNWLADILGGLVNMILFGLGASVIAVGYHDLRIAREGGDTEQIAKAFD